MVIVLVSEHISRESGKERRLLYGCCSVRATGNYQRAGYGLWGHRFEGIYY